MKLAGARALEFCARPPEAARCVLLFGGDPGLTSYAADRLSAAWSDRCGGVSLTRLSDDDIRSDPSVLADRLLSRSLWGEPTLIRQKCERETASRTVLEALADIESGRVAPEALWLIEAGDLNKSSRLRAGFEAARLATALHLYPDTEKDLAELAARTLADSGVRLSREALALFCAEMTGDRRLAVAELEKIALYGRDLGRPLTVEEIAALCGAQQNRGADDAVDQALRGDPRRALDDLDRFLDVGGAPIAVLRIAQSRLQRLCDADRLGPGGGARLRPPVFERDWPAFAAILRRWPPRALLSAQTALYDAERLCKQAGAPAEAIVRQALLALCMPVD
jgi:DNA polymerase-3 subunit delta